METKLKSFELNYKLQKKIKKQIKQIKTYFALAASHHFDKAVIYAQCSKPTTLVEAQNTSNLINFLFKVDTNPYQFMNSVEETSNKSINEYQNYQKAVSLCQFNKQILNSFARWYSHSGFEVAMLKCNIGYIIQFGMCIMERNNGKITEDEMIDQFSCIIKTGEDLFTFYPGLVMRTFIKAVEKFNEIECKIELRKSAKDC